MRPALLTLSLCLALPMSAAAETPSEADPGSATDLDRVVVTATRSQRAIVDVPGTVGAIDRERMDEALMRDLKDLFRYEPGISVTSSFGRFGLGDIRIRGLGGNRVLIQTDGIPVSDAFAIGSFSNANRNFVDLDTLKRVEIVRGPGSSLYGSDALGGVVAFITKDPADYLDAGKDRHFGFKLGYEGESEGLFGGVTTAFGGERWSGLVAVSHRQGKQTDNQGDRAVDGDLHTAPNPQRYNGRSLLTKLVYAPDAGQRVRLTVEGNEDDVATDVRSALGFDPRTGATALSLRGDDHQSRARISLDHEIDALDWAFADALQWRLYRQDSQTMQVTDEQRVTASGRLQQRHREFDFDQRLHGIEAMAQKHFATGGADHDLTYGLELTRTETRQKRDGHARDVASGQTTKVVIPDVYPVRDFPVSRATNAALYVQDEITLADGALRLVPGLRVDRYELEPQLDPIFAEDNPGIAVVGITETSVSPKLGAVWRFTDDWSLFAGYAHGFRSPPYNDVNLGFTNLQFGYTAISNPDLKPETSDGLELGVRYAGAAAYASLSGYYNRYEDFIESMRFTGFNEQGLIVFQSQNVADARIVGAELKAGVDFGALDPSLDGWSLRGALAYARGDDRSAGVPLDSIDPLRGTLGLAYDHDDWGVELAGTFADRKRRVSDPTLYRPAGYGVLDLLAHWRFAPGARLNAGIFNLADRKYTDWADVPGVAADSATLDRYTRPGRSLSLSLSLDW